MHKNGEMCRKMDSYGGSGTQVAWLQTVFFIVFGVLFAGKTPSGSGNICVFMQLWSIGYAARKY